MPAKYGVNFTISAEAARPISVQSVTPLGIVGTTTRLAAGLHFFGNVTKVKDILENDTGTVKKAIDAIYLQAVETPVILSIFKDSETISGEISNEDKSEAIKAIELLAKAEALTGYRANLIIAPYFSGDIDIASAMQGMAEKLRATAIIDLDADSESAAILKAQVYGSKRVIICDPAVKVWDVVSNSEAYAPLSSYVAALIARTDGESEYGFSDSYSNRTLSGVSGTKRVIDFMLGEDCEADRLRTAGVTTVIRYSGFRLWGGETTDIDAVWQDLARVRTFDRIAEACQKGVFYAVDRKANLLYHAKRSVEELLRNLTGSQVLIGYSVEWSKDKNTVATVTAGKFYLDVKMQNNPIVKSIELDFAYVDSYSDKLMADIG